MNSVNCGECIFKPSKIVCVGRNYSAHIAELNNETPTDMVLFVKPNSAITNTLNAQHLDEQLHYETELCFLIKNNQLAAVGLGLDLTKRQLQSQLKSKGLPWERAKAFNGSVLFTEFFPCTAQQPYQFYLQVDNELVQQGNSQLMLYSPEKILAEINQFMKLEDGDIIMTGTPSGVGEVKPGQQFDVGLSAAHGLILQHQWLVD